MEKGVPTVGESMKIALAVPHTNWVPERVKSMSRLMQAIHPKDWTETNRDGEQHFREFTDRAPNHVWSAEMWTWLRDTGADWGLQLQDDTTVAPCFWHALRAMLSALPSDAMVVGLASVHPMSAEIERQGKHWYLSPGNVVGWAYAMRHEALVRFLDDRASYDEGFRTMNEDEQIGEWCRRAMLPVWHPVPSIVDHDTTIPSTYGNDFHTHKRTKVTWAGFTEASLTSSEWWKPDASLDILPIPPQRACWFCHKNAPAFGSETGCQLCGICILKCVGKSMGVMING